MIAHPFTPTDQASRLDSHVQEDAQDMLGILGREYSIYLTFNLVCLILQLKHSISLLVSGKHSQSVCTRHPQHNRREIELVRSQCFASTSSMGHFCLPHLPLTAGFQYRWALCARTWNPCPQLVIVERPPPNLDQLKVLAVWCSRVHRSTTQFVRTFFCLTAR